MQFHPSEIFLYYNPASSIGKQSLAYATSIAEHVNHVDWNNIKLTTTLWKEIVTMLGVRPKDLLNKGNEDYQARIRGKTFTMTGWLDVLANNPHMLKAPIAIYRGKAIICQQPTDILSLDPSTDKEHKTLPHLSRYK